MSLCMYVYEYRGSTPSSKPFANTPLSQLHKHIATTH